MIPLCQLWPKYIAPGRETQRFHVHFSCLCFCCFSSKMLPHRCRSILLLKRLKLLKQQKHKLLHVKSPSLSARSYIFRSQLAKRNQIWPYTLPNIVKKTRCANVGTSPLSMYPLYQVLHFIALSILPISLCYPYGDFQHT